jgi:hypothetical protein
LDAQFSDGVYLSVTIIDGRLQVESSDPDTAAARIGLLHDYLAEQDPQASELGCLAGAIGVVGCVTGNVLACMMGSIAVACNCLPLIDDEIESVPGCE